MYTFFLVVEYTFLDQVFPTCPNQKNIIYIYNHVDVFALAQVPDFAPEQAASHRFDHVGDAWSTPNHTAVERARRARLVWRQGRKSLNKLLQELV